MKYTITKEEINALPLISFRGKINLITNREQCRNAIDDLSKAKVLGFDTECRPSFKKGEYYHVSLLQLSTEDTAYLFRLNEVTLLPEIVELLANPSIKKVGVAIGHDIQELQVLSPFEPGGFIELGDLAKKLKIIKLGLRSLTGILLGKRLSKKAQVSNWAAVRLSDVQIEYAATDAWISLGIYKSLSDLINRQ